MIRTSALICLLLVIPMLAVEPGEEWTRFRGPNGSGISSAIGIPSRFTADDFSWTVDLRGGGHSQAVVWHDRLFITSAPEDGSERQLSALSVQDGHEIWTLSFPAKPYPLHRRNHFSVSTAAVDKDGVYMAFIGDERVNLVGISHDGRKLWQSDLGPFFSQHGFGPSPMVVEGKVILQCEMMAKNGEPSPSFIAAYSTATGKLVWRTGLKPCGKASYSTPVVDHPNDRLLSSSLAHGLYGVSLSDGRLVWDLPVYDKRTVSTPVIAGNLLLGTCGSGGGGNTLAAVQMPDGKAVSAPEQMYSIRQSVSYVPSPLVSNGRLYMISDKGGVMSCYVVQSGKLLWKGRLDSDFSASPVWAEGRLFCVGEDGRVYVVKDDASFEVLAVNDLGSRSFVTPTVSENRMFFRCDRKLMCLPAKP